LGVAGHAGSGVRWGQFPAPSRKQCGRDQVEEVDFVVETPTRLLPIEVKTSRSIGKRDLRGLKAFLEEYPDGAPFGVVLYAGQEWMRPARNVVAIPWSALLGS